jgi:hypothetical protein
VKSLTRIPESDDITVEEYVSDMSSKSRTYVNIENQNVTEFDDRGNERINEKLEDLSCLGSSQEKTVILAGVKLYMYKRDF